MNLAFTDLVKTDISYVFDDGEWTRFLDSDLDGDCEDPFADLVNSFLSAPLNPGAAAANPQSVIDAFFDYTRGFDLLSRESGFADLPYWVGPRERLSQTRDQFVNAASRLNQ